MKRTIITAVALVTFVRVVLADAPPLPTCISRSALTDGRVRYVISNAVFCTDVDYTSRAEMFKRCTPNADSVEYDVTNRIIVVTGTLSAGDLKRGVDQAAGCGVVPYWDELLTRDNRSDDFSPGIYTLAYTNVIVFPDEEADFLRAHSSRPGDITFSLYSPTVHEGHRTFTIDYVLALRDGRFSISEHPDQQWIDWDTMVKMRDQRTNAVSLLIDGKRDWKAVLNARSSFCMCHSRYALRVFGNDGKYVWEDIIHVFGSVTPLSVDLDEDGTDEIVVFQHEHGSNNLLVFKRKGQRGVSKPTDGD